MRLGAKKFDFVGKHPNCCKRLPGIQVLENTLTRSTNSSPSRRARAKIDDEILKQALTEIGSGQKPAFKTLYDATSHAFHAIILKMVQDPDLAQDVLQKAYVSIWQHAARYSPQKGKAFTWMLVIMRNRALDALRARGRAPNTELIDEALPDDTQHTEARAEAFMLRKLLEEALQKQPAHIAEVIELNVLEGWSCREIGTRLNVSPNTVKSWIRRGLTNMRYDLPLVSYHAAL